MQNILLKIIKLQKKKKNNNSEKKKKKEIVALRKFAKKY